jgi:hypothetical protein
MARYITVAEVRAVCGITSSFIDDTDFGQIINSMEYYVEDKANTRFTPTTVIEQYEGDGSERLKLKHNPVLKVRALNIDDTSVTPEYVRTDKEGGIVWLTTSAETTYFKTKSTERNLVRIKYDYGVLDYTTTSTTTSADETAGDSVTVTVADGTGFSANDYVEIQGMDSYQETCKITGVSGNDLTIDNLAYPHESGSVVTKLQTPPIALRLMRIASGLAGVARVVGSSFDEITGYSLPELSVQKGEPYTQWRETAVQLRKEWDEAWKQFFRRRPTVM